MTIDKPRKLTWIVPLVFGLFATAAQGEKLTFSAFEGSPGQDISALILDEAYASIGIEIEVLRFPGLRSLKTANEGLVDGELSRVKAFQSDYPNLVAVPVPANHLLGTAFSKIEGFELRGWDSLRNYTIGITRGMKFAERGTAGMSVIVANRHKQLFQLLEEGRIDVAINPLVNGLVIIDRLGLEGIRALEPPLVHIDLYHFLHKRHTALVPKIADAIRKMKASGRIDEIRKRFFLDFLNKSESSD